MNNVQPTTSEQQKIRALSDRLVELQKPIRILDAIKWNEEIKADFFKNQFQQLPKVDQAFYEKTTPLPFDADELTAQFHVLIREIKNELGQYSGISKIMIRLCEEYCQAILMIKSRGKSLFSELAMEMYGAPKDAFYPNGPRLSDMGSLLGKILEGLVHELKTESDEKCYSAEQAVEILQSRLSNYFRGTDRVTAVLSDNIVADASAGADCIKLKRSVRFSERDLRYLEVHEGWVHVGTTLNGLAQPVCTFLAKGSPTSSITQEGLAVTTEIFTFSGYPTRMLKIMNRIRALDLVCDGANFIDVFRFFQQQGLTDDESYSYSVRVFRGSTPNGGPFTKDLSYTKGFLLIYNYIRLAVRQGLIDRIPLFFVGKTLIEDIPTLYELKQQGLIEAPKYLPPQFQDLAALSSWMGFSLFLNQFDLEAVASHYGYILRK